MRDEAAIALVLVLVIASAGAGYFVGNSSRQIATTTIVSVSVVTTVYSSVLVTTSTATRFVPIGNATSSPTSLEIQVTANVTGTGTQQQANVEAWVMNTLPVPNNVTAPADWAMANLSYNKCGGGTPVGLGLLMGHYTMENISAGHLVSGILFSCTTAVGSIQYFVFLPMSVNAIYDIQVISPPPTHTEQSVGPVSFYYSYQGLGRGEYTAIGGDEWGQIALTYFTIAS